MVRLRSLRYDIAMSETFLITGPDNPPATILLAHGAGAPMDSKSMIWAWKEKISPSEAARIRVIAGPVADRFYSDSDW